MQLPTLWLTFSFAEVASKCNKKMQKNATSGQNRNAKNAKKKFKSKIELEGQMFLSSNH